MSSLEHRSVFGTIAVSDPLTVNATMNVVSFLIAAAQEPSGLLLLTEAHIRLPYSIDFALFFLSVKAPNLLQQQHLQRCASYCAKDLPQELRGCCPCHVLARSRKGPQSCMLNRTLHDRSRTGIDHVAEIITAASVTWAVRSSHGSLFSVQAPCSFCSSAGGTYQGPKSSAQESCWAAKFSVAFRNT